MIYNFNEFSKNEGLFTKSEYDKIVLNILEDLKKDYDINNFSYKVDNYEYLTIQTYIYDKDGLIIKYIRKIERDIETELTESKITTIEIDNKEIDVSHFTKVKLYKFFKKLKKEKEKISHDKDLEKFKNDIKPENIKSRKYNL